MFLLSSDRWKYLHFAARRSFTHSPLHYIYMGRWYTVQYQQHMVLGPRLNVINLNIKPESSCNELKYSLKIAFVFLSIILKFQVPDLNILLGIRKKATVFDGPWSANVVLGPRLR